MQRKIIAYSSVYERKETKEFEFIDLIENQSEIFQAFGIKDHVAELDRIKNIQDKEERNQAKRSYIPAVDLSMSGVLSIDIDGISAKPDVKEKIIAKLRNLDTCYVAMESVSGNVVAYFKYDCTTMEFPFLYYKIYLELTLMLSINIDFLPEIGRLRYVSIGEVYHHNDNCKVLTEIMECDSLPYINTQVGKRAARDARYGSN